MTGGPHGGSTGEGEGASLREEARRRPVHAWQEALRRSLVRALEAAVAAGDLPGLQALEPGDFVIEAPKDPRHGDWATNLALVLAGRARRPPRAIAEAIARHLPGTTGWDDLHVAAVEVAGPGFLNFRLEPRFWQGVLPLVEEGGERYGGSAAGGGERLLLEFVSANPTGPLNVVNSRAAAFGDTLARLLRLAGYHVATEYYVNDAGNQFAKLSEAMQARVAQLAAGAAEPDLPEGAYPGEYVLDLAAEFLRSLDPEGLAGLAPPAGEATARRIAASSAAAAFLALPAAERLERLGRFAVERMVESHRAILERYGVRFDRWTRESEVRAGGGPERVLERLRQAGRLYEEDGAVWLRTDDLGDDRNRVLVRRSGEYTYFLPDIAYHLGKFERGFTRLVDIWGQDHHGYIPRMRAALIALGCPPEGFEVLITQMVRLVRGGEAVRMSKRKGEFVTMEEFLEEAGVDAARFFFLMRTLDSHMDFDLDLAQLKTADNPVYYVQYAHARICSILRQAEAGAEDAAEADAGSGGPRIGDPALLAAESEIALLRLLALWPEEVAIAARERQPHRVTVYARELATAFHRFYAECRVLGEEPALTAARLRLCRAVRRVLANALRLCGVTAPERM